ncbi:MAG: hypothetical protein JSS86_00945 [Cyanobacteria bacterium SZAS LIN-2]|nr:hypothetical protein [Cyanobacteria bacterium SZAS LIN-2]
MKHLFREIFQHMLRKKHLELYVEIYTDKCIDASFLENLLSGRTDVRVHRPENDPDSLQIHELTAKGKLKPGLVVTCPAELIEDFVPRSISQVMESPKWHLTIHTMEGCAPHMSALLETMYRAAAEEGNGFAVNSATNATIFQSKNMKPAGPQSQVLLAGEKPQIEIKWCIPGDADPENFIPAVIALWSEIEPRCLPTHFGSTQPYRYRAQAENMDPFFRYIKEHKQGLVFWRSTLPVVDGYFSRAADDSKWKVLPARYARYHSITLSIHSEALTTEPELLATVETLIQRTAKLLDAFFASAILKRYEPQARGHQAQHILDNYSLTFGPWWVGLSPLPVWLAWYGRQYYPFVKDALVNCPGARTIDGQNIFLKLSDQPLNLDELKQVFPTLPQELISPEVTRSTPIGSIASRAYAPAQFIPPLDMTTSK